MKDETHTLFVFYFFYFFKEATSLKSKLMWLEQQPIIKTVWALSHDVMELKYCLLYSHDQPAFADLIIF